MRPVLGANPLALEPLATAPSAPTAELAASAALWREPCRVMLHHCTILTAQRLSAHVDSDKVTAPRSDLGQGMNRVLDAHSSHQPALTPTALSLMNHKALLFPQSTMA